MKIGLVTIHYANSYGGLLQTFATQSVLSRYGETFILDYAHPNLRNTLRAVRWGIKPKDVLRVGKDMLRLLPRRRLTQKFKSFISKEFKLTKECHSADDLGRETEAFDYLVCGSDQIWNPNIIGSLDRNYFLAFSRGCKKISLSSSCGSYSFSNDEQKILSTDLRDFHAIAVREPDTAKVMSKLLGRDDVFCTPDPTLLLSGNEWRSHCSPAFINEKDYILVYTLAKDDLVREAVRFIAQKLNKRVVVIDQDLFLGFKADRHVMDASPREFLSLFSNASYVVTNSFHGTAFSLLFGKPFSTVLPHSGRNRIENLLNRVEEQDRLIATADDLSRFSVNVDCEKIEAKLAELRSEGISYLDSALISV